MQKGILKAITTCEFPDIKGTRRIVKSGSVFPAEIKISPETEAELIRVKAAKRILPKVTATEPAKAKDKDGA